MPYPAKRLTRRRRCGWRTGQSPASVGRPPWEGCPRKTERGQRSVFRQVEPSTRTFSKMPMGRPNVTHALGES